MVGKGYAQKQIINKLMEAKIHVNEGMLITEASRKIGIIEQKLIKYLSIP